MTKFLSYILMATSIIFLFFCLSIDYGVVALLRIMGPAIILYLMVSLGVNLWIKSNEKNDEFPTGR